MHFNTNALELLITERRQEWEREVARDRLVNQLRRAPRPAPAVPLTGGLRMGEILRRLRGAGVLGQNRLGGAELPRVTAAAARACAPVASPRQGWR